MPAAADAPWDGYFFCSVQKLVLLSLCTLNLYLIYWSAQHWEAIKARTREQISPAARGFFYVFFVYSLAKRIQETAEPLEVSEDYSPGLLAFAVGVFVVLVRLPDPWWLITFASPLPLLPIQRTANAITLRVAPHHASERYSRTEKVLIAVGGTFFLLGVLGTFLPE